MYTKDFHGMRFRDALSEFHTFVGMHMVNAYKHHEPPELELVTGQGVIQNRLVEELDKMDLEYIVNASNLGSIKVIL